jgi:hypothetical protein
MTKVLAFGMRRVPKLARAAALAAGVGSILAAVPAAAQDYCAGLRQAMTHAADDFQSLLIVGERSQGGAAPARTLLPDGNRCEVRTGGSVIEYRCRMTALDTPSVETRATYRREVRRVRDCFADLLPRGDGDYTGIKDWTGAVIWEPRPGLRAAVVFVAAEDIASVSSSTDDGPEESNAVWVVVDKRLR